MNKKIKGVSSIEFLFSFITMFFAFIIILELARLYFIISFVNYALPEISRYVKEFPGEYFNSDYDGVINDYFDNDSAPWNIVLNRERLELTHVSFDSLSSFPEKPLSESFESRGKYKYYTMSYHYTPLFLNEMELALRIKRTLFVGQEHEGWDDEL